MDKDIEFYTIIESLKDVKRYEPFKPLHENVAGHICIVCFLAYTMMEKFDLKLDKTKVLALSLFHDIPEME